MANEVLPDLSDQAVLITGAGRGLGKSAALHLARCGAVVGVADIDGPSAEATVSTVKAAGGKAHSYSCDVAGQRAFAAMASDFAERCGRIDAVINNAAVLKYEPLESVTEETADRMLGAGFKSAIWGSQALVRHMRPEIGGSIVNLSSPVVVRGYPNTLVYSAIKSAVTSLTRTLAAELGPRKIRVNAVAPGSVPTPGALGLNDPAEYQAAARERFRCAGWGGRVITTRPLRSCWSRRRIRRVSTKRQHDQALAGVRKLCLAMPEVSERLSHGSPAWFIRGKKTLAMFVDDHHGDGILGIWVPAFPGVQQELVDTEPDRFFRPPYVGPSGWVGVHLDRDVDWDEIDAILHDAYRKVGPKTLVKQLDAAD